MDDEFYGLQKVGTWDITKVRPKASVRAEAKRNQVVVHFHVFVVSVQSKEASSLRDIKIANIRGDSFTTGAKARSATNST